MKAVTIIARIAVGLIMAVIMLAALSLLSVPVLIPALIIKNIEDETN